MSTIKILQDNFRVPIVSSVGNLDVNIADLKQYINSTDPNCTGLWTSQMASDPSDWYGLAYGNDTFVAISVSITPQVMRSLDYGLTWESRTATYEADWQGVAFGLNNFVAISQTAFSKIMLSSNNGENWVESNVPATNWNGLGVAFGGGVFIAVGVNDHPIMRSIDGGLNFTEITDLADNIELKRVAYGNGVFIATFSPSRTYKSTDLGLTWTDISATIPVTISNDFNSISYGNGVWLITMGTFPTTELLRSTNDGVSWSIITIPNNYWTISAYGNNKWILLGQGENVNEQILLSNDNGVTWEYMTSPEANIWYGLAYGNGVFVSVSDFGTNQVMRLCNNL